MNKAYQHSITISREMTASKADCLEKIKGFKFKNDVIELTIIELADKLLAGHMVIPAETTSFKKEGFVSSSLIFVDIDNSSISSTDVVCKLTARGLAPTIGYHTYSSTPQKERFRLVFQLSETIDDQETYQGLISGLHQMLKGLGVEVDAQTYNTNRVSFGGKKIFHLEPDAVLDVSIVPVMTAPDSIPVKPADLDLNTGLEIVELLKRGQFEELKEVVKVTLPDDFDQLTFIQKLNSIDITDFFQLPKGQQFSCLFHKDSNPSAGVIHTGKNEMYSCFSCGEKLNLVGVIGKLIGGTVHDAIKVIEKVLGVTLGTDYQERMLKVAHQHKRQVRHQLESQHPELFAWMGRSNLTGFYLAMIEIGLDLVTDIPLNSENDLTFFVSQRTLVPMLKPFGIRGVSGQKEVMKKLNLLCEVGLIVKESEIERADYMATAETYKKQKGFRFRTNYYTLPMSADILSKADKMCRARKEAGARNGFTSTTQTFNQDMKLAEIVYSQSDMKAVGKAISKEQEILLELSMALIAEYGYFTEQMLSESLQGIGYKKFKADKVSGAYRPFLMSYFELMTVSKKLKEEMSLPEHLKARQKIYTQYR